MYQKVSKRKRLNSYKRIKRKITKLTGLNKNKVKDRRENNKNQNKNSRRSNKSK